VGGTGRHGRSAPFIFTAGLSSRVMAAQKAILYTRVRLTIAWSYHPYPLTATKTLFGYHVWPVPDAEYCEIPPVARPN